MADNYLHSPIKVANQFRDQLSSEKRKLGFFYVAGASMAVGIPGVFNLTPKVRDRLGTEYKEPFEGLKGKCGSENILNMQRTIRELNPAEPFADKLMIRKISVPLSQTGSKLSRQ
jgi:hypothetical protein